MLHNFNNIEKFSISAAECGVASYHETAFGKVCHESLSAWRNRRGLTSSRKL